MEGKILFEKRTHKKGFPDTPTAVHGNEFRPFGVKRVKQFFRFPFSAYRFF
jgi:hypothetical protein